MRPAGSKEPWLVRKVGNMPAFTIYGSLVLGAAKQRPGLDRTGWFGDPQKVVVGLGGGLSRGGTERAGAKAYGEPSQNSEFRGSRRCTVQNSTSTA